MRLAHVIAVFILFISVIQCNASLTLTGAGGGGGGSSIGSCSASQAFFSRAAANIAAAPTNLTPNIATWESTVDTLICAQVTAGTWANKDVEYFFSAPSQALAEMNLVSASFTAVPSGNEVFDSNVGVSGGGSADATDAHLDTQYTPTSGQMTTTSIYAQACVISNRVDGTNANTFGAIVGSQLGSTSEILLDPRTDGTNSLFAGLGTSALTPSQTTLKSDGGVQGGYTVSRTPAAPTTFSAYFNGSPVAGSPHASSGVIAGMPSFWISGNNDTTPANNFVPDTVALVALGAGLTDAQVLADHTIFTAALVAMGIQVTC